jgi:transcriptional regulator with PAS, ATPase and Fis domain
MTERTRSFSWQTSSTSARVIAFWDSGTTERALAPGQTLVLGRGEECDLQVLHGSVSRRQLAIHGGPPVTVEELGSSNGSRLRGEMLTKGVRVELLPGDILEAGGAIAVLHDAGGSCAPARAASFGGPAAIASMKVIHRTIDLVAPSSLSVLLRGETGVGKEVFAEQIHAKSPRARGPLVRINCAALPEPLLEGELFGFERGAFTGAVAAKTGLIEAANTGTLFLDEVGDVPMATQVKLLRVLESREVMRLGSVRATPVDIRLVSATHRDLERGLADGSFRADLYFRLNGLTILVPPLRERRDEILGLATHFVTQLAMKDRRPVATLSAEAIAALRAHPWPGNVRELRNVIERAVVLAGGATITPEHLLLPAAPASGRLEERQPPPSAPGGERLWEEIERRERERIVDALRQTNGNQTAAAKLLGIARRTLINRIKEFGLDKRKA